MNAPDAPYRPLLTSAARPSTFPVTAIDETGAARETPIAGEHPLTLYLDKKELVTLMTLGHAPEARITSYNVCYTKLLRPERPPDNRVP